MSKLRIREVMRFAPGQSQTVGKQRGGSAALRLALEPKSPTLGLSLVSPGTTGGGSLALAAAGPCLGQSLIVGVGRASSILLLVVSCVFLNHLYIHLFTQQRLTEVLPCSRPWGDNGERHRQGPASRTSRTSRRREERGPQREYGVRWG